MDGGDGDDHDNHIIFICISIMMDVMMMVIMMNGDDDVFDDFIHVDVEMWYFCC